MSISRQFFTQALVNTPAPKLGVTITPVTARNTVTVTDDERIRLLEERVAKLEAMLISQTTVKQSRAEYMREYRKRK